MTQRHSQDQPSPPKPRKWVDVPVLDLDLDRPFADQLRNVPPELVRRSRELIRAVLREVPFYAKALADLVRLRTANQFHGEARAAGALLGGDWRSVMLASVAYDLAMTYLACSTIALATPAGPVLARNMDWWPEDLLAKSSCLVRYRRNGRVIFEGAGWPGSVGVVSGLSSRGFGLVLNAAVSSDGFCRTGYPVLLHLRRVVEFAQSFDDAIGMLTRQKLTVGGLITVIGTENHQRVVIERGPTRFATRRPVGSEPLIATNHYRSLDESSSNVPELGETGTTCDRYCALQSQFPSTDGRRTVADDELLYALTDPAVMQMITAQHVILRPRDRSARLLVPQHLLA